MPNACWQWVPEETQQWVEGSDDNIGCGEGIAGEKPVLAQAEMGAKTVIKNDKIKLYWVSENRIRKETTARRPDVTIEYN